jgi:single-stranded DNA-binding protein
MSGFIASTPQLSRTETGDARLSMKVGQEHFTRNPDGSFTQGETSFHDLVMFRRAAEKAAAQFTKGDKFVAEGYIHAYTMTDEDGQMFEREEFVARKIGHDNAVTNYTVNRPQRQLSQQSVPMIQQGPTQAAAPSSQAGLSTFQPTAAQVQAVAVGM